MRYILSPNMLVGETIKAVNNEAVNLWTITFESGLEVVIEAEAAINTPAGSIPGLFLSPAEKEVAA